MNIFDHLLSASLEAGHVAPEGDLGDDFAPRAGASMGAAPNGPPSVEHAPVAPRADTSSAAATDTASMEQSRLSRFAAHAEVSSTAAAANEPSALDDWWRGHRARAAIFSSTLEQAIAGGFAADRMAWAFASGYTAAGEALFGPCDRLSALCASEAGGAHPRAIECRLESDGDGYRLSGTKTYVTLGTAAEVLFILASEGEDDAGRKDLRVVRLGASRVGVELTALPETPFVPEMPHARLELHRVRVEPSEVLPGDGWERWVRPFRTVEDLHVHAAFWGWVVRVARASAWPAEVIEGALAICAALIPLASADPSSIGVHRALGGVIAQSKALAARMEPEWARTDEETRQRWARDRVLLSVAGKAREARLATARAR